MDNRMCQSKRMDRIYQLQNIDMLSKFSIFTRMCESKSLGKGIFFFLVFVLGWIVGYIQFRFQILF